MLTVVIVNYKNEELTIRYVKDELSKINLEYNIVIVNNEATKYSNGVLCEALNAILVEDVELAPGNNLCYVISCPVNLGFAKANNLAATFSYRHLNNTFLLFSNNDIQIVNNDICEKLREKLEEDPRIGMIGPKVIGLDGKDQSPEPYYPFWMRYVWVYLSTPFLTSKKKASLFKLDYAENACVGYHYKVMGAFFMMRAEDYFSIDGMDPKTFLYSEETILSERLRKIGKGVYYYPFVSVIHAHGQTTKKSIGEKGINQYMVESEAYYYHKYRHVPMWQIKLGVKIYSCIHKLKKRFL